MKADEREARRIVRERAGGYCEVQRNLHCMGLGAEWHHRRNRSQGGKWCPTNGLLLCRICHAWITEHPAEAAEKGWAVKSYNDPSAIPVKYRDYPHPQMLGADGSIRDATDAELIALFGKGYEGVA